MVTRTSTISKLMNTVYDPTGESIYDDIKTVSDNIDSINAVALEDLQALTTAWNDAKDYTGITVVSGEVAGFDLGTNTLTIPTVKGDQGTQGYQGLQGIQGEDGLIGPTGLEGANLLVTSIVDNGNSTFTFTLSDSTTYTTPNLKGDTGDQGLQGNTGISVHHLKGTNTTEPHGVFGVFGELDTYTFYGDPDEDIYLGHFVMRNGFTLEQGEAAGYMQSTTYDTNHSGVVDNSEQLGGKDLTTVESERDAAILTATLGLGSNYYVLDNAAKSALTDLTVGDKVFVADDGDTKWAHYTVTAVTDGLGSTSTFEVIMDEDTYLNANSKEQIKAAYESNSNTNVFTDAEKVFLDIAISLTTTATTVPTAINELNSRLATVETTTVQEGDNVTFTGDVTGTSMFDTNGDVTVVTTVADNSHNHIKSNVTDFVETDYVHTTGIEAISGAKTFNDDVIFNGTTTTVNSTTVTTADNSIVLNNGEVGTGVTAGSAGLEVDRGLATNYAIQFDETDDAFKIGEIGSLQKVATREDTPADNGVAQWDAATNKFTTSIDPTVNSLDITTNVTVGGTVDGRDIATDGTKLDTIETGATADQTFDDIFITGSIGDTSHMDSLSEIYSHMYSAGIVDGGSYTDHGNGTISIAECTAVLRETGGDSHTKLIHAKVAASSPLALTDNALNIVIVSHNSGAPIYSVTSSPAVVNMLDVVPLYMVVREGLVLHVLDAREQNVDHIGRAQTKEFYTAPFTRKSGGAIISDNGTLHVGCTAGAFYFQLNELPLPVLDTTGIDTIEQYKHVAGSFVETEVSTLDNAFYDDGTDLVALGSNKYGVHWIYGIVGNNPHYAALYGTAEYGNLAAAEDATVPINLPPSVENIGILLGRAIVQEGQTEVVAIDTAFATAFSSTLATNHEELAGLLGGTVGDHQHLTSTELTKLTNIEDNATADQTGTEIKTLYEAEANTNAFTDAEKTSVDIAVVLDTVATTLPSAINELVSASQAPNRAIRSCVVSAPDGAISIDTVQTVGADIQLEVGTGVADDVILGYSMIGDDGGLVLSKNRDSVFSWVATNTISGAGKYTKTDSTDVETVSASQVSAFNSDGFTVGTGVSVNEFGANIVHYVHRTDTKLEPILGTELVTNGTFDVDTTGWTAQDGAVISIDAGRLKLVNGTATAGSAYYTVTLEVGRTYVLTGQDVGGDTNFSAFFISPTSDFSQAVYVSGSGGVVSTFDVNGSFVATASTMYIILRNEITTINLFNLFDNISVKQVTNVECLDSVGLPTTCHSAPSRGFSMVGYQGNGLAGHQIQHHLTQKPKLVITKNRDTVSSWIVSGSILEHENFMYLNLTNPLETLVASEDDTITHLSVGNSVNLNESASNHIAYAWHDVPNTSKIDTYFGTGAAGNHIDLRLDMTKAGSQVWIKSLAAGNWYHIDNIRGLTQYITINTSGAEVTDPLLTFNENGISLSTTSPALNGNNTQYLIMAFTADYFKPINDGIGVNNHNVTIAKGFDALGNNIDVNKTIVGAAHTGMDEGTNYLYVDESSVVHHTKQKPVYSLDSPNVVSPSNPALYTTTEHDTYKGLLGTVSASSEHTTYPAWKAFEKDTTIGIGDGIQDDTSSWLGVVGDKVGAFLQYKFDSPKTVTSLRFRRPYASDYDTPSAFTLSASNDGIVWDTLTSEVGISLVNTRDWTTEFTFINIATYTYYKFTIDAIETQGGTTFVSVGELELNFSEKTDWYNPTLGVFDTDGDNYRTYIGECYVGTDGKAISAIDYKSTARVADLEVYRDMMVKGDFVSNHIDSTKVVEPYTPVLLNGLHLASGDTFTVSRDANNIVHINGILRSVLTTFAATLAFTLPEELVPDTDSLGLYLPIGKSTDGSGDAHLQIHNDGSIAITSNVGVTWLMLNIAYKAKG